MTELGGERVEPFLAPRDQHQSIAPTRQLPRELGPEPGGSSGDQRDRRQAQFGGALVECAMLRRSSP